MTKVGLLCGRIIETGWLAAAITVPLYFNIYSSRVFEPDKLIALRGIVLLMVLAFFVRLFERGFSLRVGDKASSGLRAWWQAVRTDNPLASIIHELCASLILSTIASVSPGVSLWGSYQRLQGTYTWLTYIVLFFLVAHSLRSRAQLNRLITVILLTSLPVSLYGIAQHQRLDPLPWGGDVTTRVASSMGNAIFLAAYLIMAVPLTIARLIESIRRLEKADLPTVPSSWQTVAGLLALILLQNLVLMLIVSYTNKSANLWWGAFGGVAIFLNLAILVRVRRPTRETVLAEVVAYASLMLVQLTAIVLTQSRGPFLGIGAGVFVFAFLLAIRSGSQRLLSVSSAVTGVLIAFLIVFNVPNSPLAPIKKIPYIGRLGEILETEYGSGKVRLLIWQGAWQLITHPPSVGLQGDALNSLRPIIGYGPEAMYVAYNKVYPPDLAHHEARNASPDRSHQVLLDLLVTTGVVGLAAFLFVLGSALRLAWSVLRRSEHLHYQLLVIGIVSAISAHFVETQFGIPIASTLTHLWLLLGAVVAVGVMHRDELSSVVANGGTPVVEETAAAPKTGETRIEPARGEGQTRNKRRKRKGAVSTPAPASGRGTDAVDVAWPVPAVFVFLSAFAMLVLATWPPFDNMQYAFAGGFFWLIVGIVAASVGLGDLLRRGARWEVSRLWIHLPAVFVALIAIMLNLNVVSADIYYKRGFMFESQRQWEASIQAYQDALKLAPDQDFYYLFLGRLFLESAKANNRPKLTPAPKIDLEYVKTINPRDLQRLGRDDLLEASRIALEEAQKLAPLNTDHTANLGRLYRFWGAAVDKTKMDLSLKYYSDAVTLSPETAQLWDEYAEVYLAGGQIDQGIEKLKVAESLDGQFPLTFLYLGDAYITEQKAEEAFSAHAKVLSLDPQILSDQRLEYRVNFYLNAKIADRLAPLYAAAAAKYPSNPAVLSAYGYILSRLGSIPEASREFEAWVKVAPRDWIARRNLALSYESLGNLDGAIREAEEARTLAPSDQKDALSQWLTQLNQKKKQ
ncbi:MAG: O-antigen ligase family protein [Chloroflexi bacterium]|nr:O-antigen ligase family protein [Chloroflexota bacterium]